MPTSLLPTQQCPREHYVELAKNSSDTLDVRCSGCENSPPDQPADFIQLSDQRRWKYALDTDGWGPALRFYKLLGGGGRGPWGREPSAAGLPAAARACSLLL